MRVLVACEFSGRISSAFREKGHDAFSCDIEPTLGDPDFHFECDVFSIYLEKWDMMICHPPCTFLTVAANRSFLRNPERWQARLDAVKFAWKLWNAPIEFICMENPVGVLSTYIGKPDQWMHPSFFGHSYSKKTGLWLKNLPPLEPTDVVEQEWVYLKTGKRMSKHHYSSSGNGKFRSITEPGVANAMANQWG